MTSKNQTNPYIYGIGRKKESTAIVYLVPFTESTSQITCEVNGHKAEQYFQQNFTYLNQISLPLKKVKLDKKYKIIANVKGGGLTGQADSIRLGIARALCKVDKINFRPILKFEGFLKRDARIKERRKYGLKKARKASQYSKR
uniref:Small ribosomal subunit protein uS9c n=7 Tax=Laminariaceae TaxID=33636 RepID=A0A8K1SSR2_9PHAE|nr:30S ribosomal protein S9 [Saccharina japonica]YP_009865360.1 30S ribosomal protein S9 [Saccharina latissima]YP_010688175.1 30S ribosomal protein S9 [Saccharina longissima]YP_010863424.1 30S ribosomal protein S9 [Saccharina japonica x Saccharina latissima]YP_011006691.1 30S ribosomal protein S9 [Hedophyllum nigripes]QOV02304.1 30S ribosomal protein S9 [Saccharina sp. ye-B]QWK43022.1 ribosomal protein S9 [Saccharina subsessilis]QWK44015.1 ribosomal protein S9 [Arthrothamnus bifidus]UBI4147